VRSRFPIALKRLVRSGLIFENALYEYRLGITTHGLYNWNSVDWKKEEHVYYGSTFYRRIFRVLDALNLGPSDIFVDLGCGKGRITCCASLYPVREVIGVEDVPELCVIAEQNLDRLRSKRTQARILHGKAEEFDYTEATVIYMFHPFGPNTLASVLSKIEKGLRANPRDIRIVYVNPVHEYVLEQTKWLELYDRWPPVRLLQAEIFQSVSFWTLRQQTEIGGRASADFRCEDPLA
jgi:precorrin-6B methylase 2